MKIGLPQYTNSLCSFTGSRDSKIFKALTKELKIPVIVRSQLNRKSEDRSDKRASRSNHRESGTLEQDTNIAVLVYRDIKQYVGMEIPHVMNGELIVEKNRNGSIGVALVACEKRLAHFANKTNVDEQF